MAEISREDLRDLLSKNWMTHDAMWLMHCMGEVGMEAANRINQKAVKSMALIEVKRLAQAVGMERVESFDQFRSFIAQAVPLVIAGFMNISFELHEPDQLHCRMHTCFAHDGIQRLGVIEQYDCGIFLRIEGWLAGLGIGYEVEPEVTKCMMHTDGECWRNYTLGFSGAGAA